MSETKEQPQTKKEQLRECGHAVAREWIDMATKAGTPEQKSNQLNTLVNASIYFLGSAAFNYAMKEDDTHDASKQFSMVNDFKEDILEVATAFKTELEGGDLDYRDFEGEEKSSEEKK